MIHLRLFSLILAASAFKIEAASTLSECLLRLREGSPNQLKDLLENRSSRRMRRAHLLRCFRGSCTLQIHEHGQRIIAELEAAMAVGDTTDAISLIRETMAGVEIPFRKLKAAREIRTKIRNVRGAIRNLDGEQVPAEEAKKIADAFNALLTSLRPSFTYNFHDRRAIEQMKSLKTFLVKGNKEIDKRDLLARVDNVYKWLDTFYTYLKNEIGVHIADYIAIRSYLESDFENRFDSNVEVVSLGTTVVPETVSLGADVSARAPVAVAAHIPTPLPVNLAAGHMAHRDPEAKEKWMKARDFVLARVGMNTVAQLRLPSLEPGRPPLHEILTMAYTSDQIQHRYSKQAQWHEANAALLQLAWDSILLLPTIISRIPRGIREGKIDGIRAGLSTIFEGLVRKKRDGYLTDIKEFVDKSLALKESLPPRDDQSAAAKLMRKEWALARLSYLADRFGNNKYGYAYLECMARDADVATRSLFGELYKFVNEDKEELYKVLVQPMSNAIEAAKTKSPITISNSRIRPSYYAAVLVDITAYLTRAYWMGLFTGDDEDDEGDAIEQGQKRIEEAVEAIKRGSDVSLEPTEETLEEAAAAAESKEKPKGD